MYTRVPRITSHPHSCPCYSRIISGFVLDTWGTCGFMWNMWFYIKPLFFNILFSFLKECTGTWWDGRGRGRGNHDWGQNEELDAWLSHPGTPAFTVFLSLSTAMFANAFHLPFALIYTLNQTEVIYSAFAKSAMHFTLVLYSFCFLLRFCSVQLPYSSLKAHFKHQSSMKSCYS